MSLPKWLLDAGGNPALWCLGVGADPALRASDDATVWHVVDDECWAFSYKGYTNCRVPDALAPAIIQLIEAHYPKPPSDEEAVKLSADLVSCLGPIGVAQFIRSVSTLGEAPTARAVLECAAHAYRTDNGIDGAYAPALQRTERWLEQTKEVPE